MAFKTPIFVGRYVGELMEYSVLPFTGLEANAKTKTPWAFSGWQRWQQLLLSSLAHSEKSPKLGEVFRENSYPPWK